MSTDEIRAIELLSRVSYGRVATSMRAMPFVAPARHVVADGRVLLRMHRGLGYHRACNGSVVAYGADNCDSGADHLWAVQFTGTAEIVEPTPQERAAFGPEPVRVDGEPFTPVFLRIEPQFVTVHELDYSGHAGAGPQDDSEATPAAGPGAGPETGPAARPPAGSEPRRETRPGRPSVERRLHHAA
ncbi:pyridoxamine 5'-phosphate oxidase family protein [Streptomyces litmocidini]|uniref:pyridoxamine 5'-phosphate oxidase family protein n=1 Tax=Streptomyces litmocidini TaxID=67318 RepID=UPI0036F97C00